MPIINTRPVECHYENNDYPPVRYYAPNHQGLGTPPYEQRRLTCVHVRAPTERWTLTHNLRHVEYYVHTAEPSDYLSWSTPRGEEMSVVRAPRTRNGLSNIVTYTSDGRGLWNVDNGHRHCSCRPPRSRISNDNV